MTHYEALRTGPESDLVLRNDSKTIISSTAVFHKHDVCVKVASMLNALPEVVEALEAIEATKIHKIPSNYDDNGVWLVSAGAVRKVEKALAKLREAS